MVTLLWYAWRRAVRETELPDYGPAYALRACQVLPQSRGPSRASPRQRAQTGAAYARSRFRTSSNGLRSTSHIPNRFARGWLDAAETSLSLQAAQESRSDCVPDLRYGSSLAGCMFP